MSFRVVAYDIGADGRRRALHKTLRAMLTPWQQSVFVGEQGPVAGRRVRAALAKFVVGEGDRAHVFELCDACRQRTRAWGEGHAAMADATRWGVG